MRFQQAEEEAKSEASQGFPGFQSTPNRDHSLSFNSLVLQEELFYESDTFEQTEFGVRGTGFHIEGKGGNIEPEEVIEINEEIKFVPEEIKLAPPFKTNLPEELVSGNLFGVDSNELPMLDQTYPPIIRPQGLEDEEQPNNCTFF